MTHGQYVKTVIYNGHMVNVGLDDAGQCYFLEYLDDDGKLAEISCGAYNHDYQYFIEYLFGKPKLCVHYGVGPCATYGAHGYCNSCQYSPFYRRKDDNDERSE